MRNILVDYMARFSDAPIKELEEIAEKVLVETYEQGTVLLHQGDVPDRCYFVLKGCIRQYTLDEEGRETTSQFYTEEQSITIFTDHSVDKTSRYTLSCVEDCVLVVGDLTTGSDELTEMHPALEAMTRKMMEANIAGATDHFANFVAQKPEDRYKTLLENRPDLLERVPQHQLASYLGITPESLSRIKKRLHTSDGDA